MQIADPVAVVTQVFVISFQCFYFFRINKGGARTYQDIFAARFGIVFDVESDEVLGEFAVERFVHFVEDEVEKVKAGDERRWEIDVAGDGQVDVVF
jgi:hypothetical protein